VAPDVFKYQAGRIRRASHDNAIATLQNFLTPNPFEHTAHLGVSYTFASDSEDISAVFRRWRPDTTLGFVPGASRWAWIHGRQRRYRRGARGPSGRGPVFHYIAYQGSDDLNWIKGKKYAAVSGFLFNRIADDFYLGPKPAGRVGLRPRCRDPTAECNRLQILLRPSDDQRRPQLEDRLLRGLWPGCTAV